MSASRVLAVGASAIKASKKKPAGQKLQETLDWLKQEPQLLLPAVRSLSLTYAMKNDHFGARHFAKEDLPRISYANQNLKIDVQRKVQTEPFEPLMTVSLDNGKSETINMSGKSSDTILEQLLALGKKR